MVDIGLPNGAFDSDWEFWYYYRQIRNESGNTEKFVKEIPTLTEELESWDIILLVITELNLAEKSWKFIDRSYQAYFPPGCPCKSE